MAVSRMDLGVHYPQDVMLGLILGSLNLWLFVRYSPILISWFLAKKVITQSLYLIVFGLLIQLIAVWLHDAFEYRQSLFASSGVLIGGVAGVLVCRLFINFNIIGVWRVKAISVLIGLMLVGLFYVSLSWLYYFVFEDTQLITANLFYQIRYALIGALVTLIVPLIFVKMKIFKMDIIT